jgi:hypothetical protein
LAIWKPVVSFKKFKNYNNNESVADLHSRPHTRSEEERVEIKQILKASSQ